VLRSITRKTSPVNYEVVIQGERRENSITYISRIENPTTVTRCTSTLKTRIGRVRSHSQGQKAQRRNLFLRGRLGFGKSAGNRSHCGQYLPDRQSAGPGMDVSVQIGDRLRISQLRAGGKDSILHWSGRSTKGRPPARLRFDGLNARETIAKLGPFGYPELFMIMAAASAKPAKHCQPPTISSADMERRSLRSTIFYAIL
jgi:hypothetical protein